ncbi:MAG TPA: hypothetical protein VF899_06490, partial [Pyrinomonadaceae bacterium]
AFFLGWSRAAIRTGDKHACLDFMRDKPWLKGSSRSQIGDWNQVAADDSAYSTSAEKESSVSSCQAFWDGRSHTTDAVLGNNCPPRR